MIESLLSSNTSNRYKFIMTPTRSKNLWPPSQKCNYDSYFIHIHIHIHISFIFIFPMIQENQGL